MSARGRAVFALMLLASLVAASGAQAAIVTFSGADDGAGPGDPRPFADAAASAFDGAVGLHSLITFEGLPVGNFGSLGVAPGVTATLSNLDSSFSGISNVDQHSPTPLGYNTTSGGSQFLQVAPFFNDAIGGSVTFTFAQPVDAFGAYLTDTQVGFPGLITVTFSDGLSQVLPVSKNSDLGGVLFFGFTDFGASIASISYNTGATDSTRDVWGIDDVRYATPVPEPGTLSLLAAGAGLLLRRRRR
jgi:PEP-CTERM motif-containing protein